MSDLYAVVVCRFDGEPQLMAEDGEIIVWHDQRDLAAAFPDCVVVKVPENIAPTRSFSSWITDVELQLGLALDDE